MRFNVALARPEVYLEPGFFHSTSDDIVISTLLGSCISVALFDPIIPAGGLNHFMLPFSRLPEKDALSDSAKYGVNAMELLINDMLKKGGKKARLRAKVFGGSTVIGLEREATFNVPKMNIDFIFDFLDRERIPVDAYSVGGTMARKIHFFPVNAKVLMRFSRGPATSLAHRESAYAHRLLEETHNNGKPILF